MPCHYTLFGLLHMVYIVLICPDIEPKICFWSFQQFHVLILFFCFFVSQLFFLIFFFSPHQTKKRRSSSSPPLLVNGKTCLCECFFAEAMPSSVSLSPFRVPVAVPAGISPDACPPGGQRPKTNKIVFIAFHPTSDYFSIQECENVAGWWWARRKKTERVTQ